MEDIIIQSKTPLRVSLAGGGTDLRDYYKIKKGAVISFTIDKYLNVTVKKTCDNTIVLRYPLYYEDVDHQEMVKHSITKEVLKFFDIKSGIEIISYSDVPAGTGLGSSSSFTVGLINALFKFTGQQVNPETLAKIACEIEIDLLNKPIGKQDQYAAALGGCNYFQFNPDESVSIKPLELREYQKYVINEELLLFYTGIQRSADLILADQKSNIDKKRQELNLMRLQAEKLYKKIQNGEDLTNIGKLLKQGWEYKKKLSNKICTSLLNEYYNRALKAGAIGGKITGAGGGGMLLLHCPKKYQQNVRQELFDLREIKFNYVDFGSSIVKPEYHT